MIGGCALNHGLEKRSVRGCGTSMHSGCERVVTGGLRVPFSMTVVWHCGTGLLSCLWVYWGCWWFLVPPRGSCVLLYHRLSLGLVGLWCHSGCEVDLVKYTSSFYEGSLTFMYYFWCYFIEAVHDYGCDDFVLRVQYCDWSIVGCFMLKRTKPDVGVPTFHGWNNEYQQWTIVYNSIRQWIGMRRNRDRGKCHNPFTATVHGHPTSAHGPLFQSMIECTATDHVIFPHSYIY